MYQSDNIDKRNEYIENFLKQRVETDVNYRLIRHTRNRICHAWKGKSKKSSTKSIMGIDIHTYRKRFEYQFTPQMNWSTIEIDHLKSI